LKKRSSGCPSGGLRAGGEGFDWEHRGVRLMATTGGVKTGPRLKKEELFV